MELVALKAREKAIQPKLDEINNQVKAGTLTREAGKTATDKLYADTFNPRELRILKESTSNFEFHYLGSARIMAQIGKGFAEAMVALIKQTSH